MKIKSLVVRNAIRKWQDEADALRADEANLSGHRGDILAKTAGTTGPRTAQAPDDGPVNIVTPGGPVFSASPRWSLSSGSFSQDWTTTTLITTNDDWSGVPAIVGYLGDIDAGTTTNVDPRTLTGAATGAVDVIANQSNTGSTAGGVAEFDGVANPTVALQGSGTADAPSLVIYLDATGRENVRFQCNLRDIDGSADNSAQQINIQYRTDGGTWINVPGGYFADVTTGPSLATAVTAVDVILPVGAANASALEIRIMTTNAGGNDEWVGIDDIVVSSTAIGGPPTLSIDDVTLAEGDSGTVTFTFTVSLSAPAGVGGVTFDIATADGTAQDDNPAPEDNDYVGISLTGQTIPEGSSTYQFDVTVNADDLPETGETFFVNVTNVTGATVADGQGQGTITNDDANGTFAIDDVSQAEGNSGTTNFTFTVTRSGGDDGAVSADWAVDLPGGPGFADASDVTGTLSGTVNFADGVTSQTISISVNGDTAFEPDEGFNVNLSNAGGGATIADTTGAGTITNDDPAPAGTLSIDDVSLAEGDSGPTSFTFTVTRSGGSNGAVTADYAIAAPGGAGNASTDDFVTGAIFAGQVSFADGETVQTITIDVEGDADFEANEAFTVTLSNATGGAAIGDGSGAGTIQNDDVAPPVLSIGDASLVEGDDGVTYLVFTVSLSSPSLGTVTVDFGTADATAVEDSDYLGLSGQVSFAPGETVQTISVPLIGDEAPENNETFTVTLSNPGGAVIGDGGATGTITNDDGSAYYSLAGGSFTQSWTNTGLITANDNWGGVPFIVGYRGDDLTTATGTDARTITTTSAVIDVNANQSNPSTFVTGGVSEFEIANPAVGLSGSGTADAPYLALYMDATGRADIRVQANIRDLDASADDAAQQIAVQYRTSPTGPWLNAPGGYFADVTTAGSATQVTAVDITLPADANGASQLEIRFLTTNAAGNDEYVGIDDIVVSSVESAPVLSIANAAVFEGDAGPTVISFTVTRAGSSTGAVTADYAVLFGSGPFDANAGDLTALSPLSGQVSFADGETSATITLSVDGDTGPEGDDNFTVQLSNPGGGATISDGTATGTIVNDDGPPPLVTIGDVTVTEGDAGTSLMTFTVTRSGGTGAFAVDWQTFDGSATAGGDYVAASGTVSFADGQMTDTVTVAITVNGDTDPELSETLEVHLSNATNFALITDAVGIGTIAGDDPIFIHYIQGTSYFSPILAAEGITNFNQASAGFVTVRAIVTAVDNVGTRQGYYLSEEVTDWDGNSYTSEGIFVMTRDDSGVGAVVSGVTVGDLVQLSAQVMEYQAFSTMPRTILVNSTGLQVVSSGNALPTITLTGMPNEMMTGVTPDYLDSSDGVGDTFDASVYALSYFETVEGMLVTIPDMVVADGFVSTPGGELTFQAYSLDSANPDQISSRGGYTIAGDPPIGPPDTPGTGDDTLNGGQILHDGDVNPDIVELDFTDFAISAPVGLTANASMGDLLGDVTGIIDFDFTDRKLFVTEIDPGSFVDTSPTQEVTVFGGDSRSLTVATFNVENLDPGDGAARFTALANAIANNLNAPDILCIEEMQDNNGATATGGADASTTWQMLVDALNLATGKVYQWVDQEPNGSEGGEPGGNIRVGFLYDTGRVQLGDLAAGATLAERRQYTDRIGDGVRDAGDLIAFSDDMLGAEIQTADWSGTRRSLLGEFTFNGNVVYVTANHWPAKGGSGDFWQFDQSGGDPDNSGWDSRNDVAQDVYAMLDLIQAGNANAGLVAGGDFNDFYFYRPLTTVTGHTMADGTARIGGARFENLTLTLAEAERYTYTFDGRSQAIDHVIVNSLLGGVASYDVVHLNTGFNPAGTPALSDHDPAVASFDFRSLAEGLTGTAGADLVDGFGGNDQIATGAGNDILIGGAGADTLAGGLDNDWYFTDGDGDVVVETAGEGADRLFAGASYTLAAGVSIERMSTDNHAGTAAIDLAGNELANIIYGNAGDNVLTGGAGADAMIGWAGNDWFHVDHAADQVVEAAGEGSDRVVASLSYTLGVAAHVELMSTSLDTGTAAINLTGNGFANTIHGNDGNNVLNGRGGADMLVGRLGNDWFHVDNAGDTIGEAVGEGSDRLFASASYTLNAGAEVELMSTDWHTGTAAIDLTGNELANLIYGNDGANVLDGKGGNDTLIGWLGQDSFAFTTALGAGNVDRIVDFSGADDTIRLDDAVFAQVGPPGTLDADAFHTGTAAQDAEDRIVYNAATGQLFYDADGNGAGAAILFATLQGAPSLGASDFVVI